MKPSSVLILFSLLVPTLRAAETLTFDANLEGFTPAGSATSVTWSASHSGSMRITAAGGWAGDAATINLGDAPAAFWSEIKKATQNGGELSFDVTITGSEQSLTGDEKPDWFELVVIGNSTTSSDVPPGTGGWDSNVISLGIWDSNWPLAPDTRTINIVMPILKEPSLANDRNIWWDVTPNWSQLLFGLNNDGAAVSQVVAYIDNITVTAFSAEPGSWPGGTTYSTDFSGTLAPFWTLEGWTAAPLPTPVTLMTRNQSDQTQYGLNSVIGDSDGGGAAGYFYDPDTGLAAMTDTGDLFDTPLNSIKATTSLSTLDPGFGGKWLQNLPTATRDGKATLTFNNLPPHSGIDLDFVLAAYDTIDTGDWFGNTLADGDADPSGNGYNFRITVDGTTVHENRFENSGYYNAGPPAGIDSLGHQLHFSAQYRENWGFDDSGMIPANVNHRHSASWAEDSAYSFNDLFNTTDNLIPHTADTLSIVFEHAFNGGWTGGYQDEGIAIDGFTLTLVGAGLPPFEITKITLDDILGELTLSWNAVPGTRYAIFYTDDLTDLQKNGDVGDSYFDNQAGDLDPAEGHVRIAFPHPDENAPELFFSVHKL